MINRIKYTVFTVVLLLITNVLAAQEMTSSNASSVEMAEGLYKSGKIYVVVVVLSVIMTGILGYLIVLDRKISKLEKEVKSK